MMDDSMQETPMEVYVTTTTVDDNKQPIVGLGTELRNEHDPNDNQLEHQANLEDPDEGQVDLMLEWAEKIEAQKLEAQEVEDNLDNVSDHFPPQDGPSILPEGLPGHLIVSPIKGLRPSSRGQDGHLPKIMQSGGDIIARLPSPSSDIKLQHERSTITKLSARGKYPPKVRVTRSLSSRARSRTAPSVYYEDQHRIHRKKVITWDEATNARPPLKIDMDGPTFWSYTPRNKPLNETNSPSYSFGRKCSPEKSGGSRTSNEKTWFQTPHIWVQKADFFSDKWWPTPAHYETRLGIGSRQATHHETPCYTMGFKRGFVISKYGAESEPSPNHYNKEKADRHVLRQAPSLSHSWRHAGTSLWEGREKTPGPGSYNPDQSTSMTKRHFPSFSIRGIRGSKKQELGPFATF